MSEPTDAPADADPPEGLLQKLRTSKSAKELRYFMATEIGLSRSPGVGGMSDDDAFSEADAGDGDGE
jgi:hypothetical protein